MQPKGEAAYTRYKYWAKKSLNGVGIKTPLQFSKISAIHYFEFLVQNYFNC